MPGYRFPSWTPFATPESAVFTNEYEGRTTSRPFQKGFPPHLVVSCSRWLSDVDVFDPQTIASHNLNFLLRFRFKMASLSVWDHLHHTFDTTQRWLKAAFSTSSLHFRTFVYISAVNAYRHCIVRVKRIVRPYVMVKGCLVKRCQ